MRKKTMKQVMKDYFIPHEDNNYHPCILHTKRAIFYSSVFVLLKVFVIGVALLLPNVVFVLPDVLAQQQVGIVALTNEVRAEQGLPPFKTQTKLYTSSGFKASDMVEFSYFSHVGPENKGLAYFLGQAGYEYSLAGENLAMGFSDAASVVNAWVKSPTHYANLIDPEYIEFGVGLESGTYDGFPTVYVAQHFGLPRNAPSSLAVSVTPEPVPEPTPEPTPSPTPSPTPTPTPTPEPTPAPKPVEPAGETPPTGGEAPKPIPTTPASKPAPTPPPTQPESPSIPAAVPSTPPPEPSPLPIASEIIPTSTTSPLVLFPEDSLVAWEDTPEGTKLTAVVHIEGDVESAVVGVSGYTISLTTTTEKLYSGSIVIPESSDRLFEVIVAPSITILSTDGQTTHDFIPWKEVKVVSPTPMKKYTAAKNTLASFTKFFEVSEGIYIVGIMFFSIALLLNIFVEIRRQHYHIIAQTLLLIVLLVGLWRV